MWLEHIYRSNHKKIGKEQYRIRNIGILIVLFLLFLFLYIPKGWCIPVAEKTEPSNKINAKSINLKDDQKKLEKDIEILRNDIQRGIIEGYNRNNEAMHRLTNFIGVLATIFGIIIALAGLFIGFESIRSRRRREEAIRTLEDAKLYVEDKKKDFDKTVGERRKEMDKLVQMLLEQLTQDTEQAAKKVEEESARRLKEIEEKGIAIEETKKIELLEKRIKFFEEIGIPDDPKLLFSKAMVCKEKEMWVESLELLKRATSFDKDYKEAYFQIGWIQNKLGNYKDAIEAYKQVIKLDSKDYFTLNNMGVALENLNDKEGALDYYNKALEVKPYLTAYRNKADILNKLERHTEALEAIDKAIEQSPEDLHCYTIKSSILTYLDRKDEALKTTEIVAEKNQNQAVHVYYIMGRILAKKGNWADSKECYKKAIEILKKKLQTPDASEGDWLSYFELLLILDEYLEAEKLKPQLKKKIVSLNYLYIFDFLLACLAFLKNGVEDGFKQLSIFLDKFDKAPLLTRVAWIFDDINIPLESKLENNIFQICSTVEKFLFKEISLTTVKKIFKKN